MFKNSAVQKQFNVGWGIFKVNAASLRKHFSNLRKLINKYFVLFIGTFLCSSDIILDTFLNTNYNGYSERRNVH